MANDSQARHDVFISYSSKDKKWADAACGVLEMHKIRCWIAPRDITPGTEWGASIISGMDSSKVMVLIFSTHANQSAQVRREVERAIGKGLIVLPFRIEDVSPEGAMEYALSNTHWLDGFTPPLEQQFALLARSVNVLLGKDVEPMAATAPAKPAVVASARPREGLRVTDDGPAKTKGSPRPEPKTEGLARFRETESSNRADPDVAAEPRRPRLCGRSPSLPRYAAWSRWARSCSRSRTERARTRPASPMLRPTRSAGTESSSGTTGRKTVPRPMSIRHAVPLEPNHRFQASDRS